MKRSLRNRLLFWFLIFSLLTIILTVIFNTLHFNKKARITTVLTDINTLHVNMLRSFINVDDLFSFETSNIDFFKSRSSPYLTAYRGKNKLIFSELDRLSRISKTYKLDVSEDLEIIKQHLEQYEQTVNQMLELVFRRGFKDYGLEGQMREYVHLLEKFPELNQVHVLSLRRHEKDYIIRNEKIYVDQLNALSKIMRDDVKRNNYMSPDERDSVLMIIDHYVELFNEIVLLDQRIGIKENTRGLKQQLNNICTYVEGKLDSLISIADVNRARLFRELQILYIVFFILLVVGGLSLSWYISKKITSPLLKLTEFIDELIRNNFKKSGEIELDYSHREIDLLYHEFRDMVDQLNHREIERENAEKALKESELKYRELADMLPLSIYETNELGNFTYVNKTWYSTFGYTRENIESGLNLIETVISDQGDQTPVSIPNGGNEYLALTKDGRKFSALVYSSPIIQNGGRAGFRGIILDIEERKKYIEALKNEKIKAEESDRLKSAFLANMSHEIRTPMNAIIGFSDLLAKLDITSSDRTEFIKHIKNSGKLLLNLIDDIIDIAKIEAGELKIQKGKTYINQILEEVLMTFREDVRLNSGEDRIVLKVEKPDTDDRFAIYTDPFRIKQILTNLVGNAVKFTARGYVHFGYIFKPDHLLFFVRDTGIGLSRENQKLVFDRFRQVEDSNTRKYGGTGLGLAISKHLIELLGGSIWLESELNKGTIFYFKIPLDRAEASDGVNWKEITVIQNFNWSDKKMLIVEDDETNFIVLREMMKRTGISILRAANGREAINICNAEENIDVVLMDIQMPVMNGYQATRTIKEQHPRIPVIAQTAYAMAGEREKSLEAGCDDYIPKPININLLMTKICSCINARTKPVSQYSSSS